MSRVRVYFHKTGDSDTDYLVDHSIIMYLIDPAGDFVTFYGEQYCARACSKHCVAAGSLWHAGQHANTG